MTSDAPKNNAQPDDAEAENQPQSDVQADETVVELDLQGSEEQDEIAQLKEQLADMREKWMRAVAEAENTRKRAQKDKEETSRYAISGFARDMAAVLENLIRASSNIPESARQENELLKTLGEGVDLTRNELLNIFEKYGIKRIHPLGEKFDHNFHQAMVQVENNEVEPGTVVEVVQAGYSLQDRLLMPAMVAVSKRSENAPPETGPIDTVV